MVNLPPQLGQESVMKSERCGGIAGTVAWNVDSANLLPQEQQKAASAGFGLPQAVQNFWFEVTRVSSY
jgi:hypothetical protein